MIMRVLPITAVIGSSILSPSFAQHYGTITYNNRCSRADQNTCCEMTFDRFEGARNFCIDHGCSQNVCYVKPSSYVDDDDDDYRSHGGASNWGAPQTNSWGGSTQQWGDWGTGWGSDGHPTFSPTVSPTDADDWSEPEPEPVYYNPKTYYPPPPAPKPYYPPPVPVSKPYYPPPAPAPVPKTVEVCCVTGADECPMDFPTETQEILFETVRICCGLRRVYDTSYGGSSYGGYTNSYGGGDQYYHGGGYQAQPYQKKYQSSSSMQASSYVGSGYKSGHQAQTSHYSSSGGYGHRNLQGLQQCPTMEPTDSPSFPPTQSPTANPTRAPTNAVSEHICDK